MAALKSLGLWIAKYNYDLVRDYFKVVRDEIYAFCFPLSWNYYFMYFVLQAQMC